MEESFGHEKRFTARGGVQTSQRRQGPISTWMWSWWKRSLFGVNTTLNWRHAAATTARRKRRWSAGPLQPLSTVITRPSARTKSRDIEGPRLSMEAGAAAVPRHVATRVAAEVPHADHGTAESGPCGAVEIGLEIDPRAQHRAARVQRRREARDPTPARAHRCVDGAGTGATLPWLYRDAALGKEPHASRAREWAGVCSNRRRLIAAASGQYRHRRHDQKRHEPGQTRPTPGFA